MSVFLETITEATARHAPRRAAVNRVAAGCSNEGECR